MVVAIGVFWAGIDTHASSRRIELGHSDTCFSDVNVFRGIAAFASIIIPPVPSVGAQDVRVGSPRKDIQESVFVAEPQQFTLRHNKFVARSNVLWDRRGMYSAVVRRSIGWRIGTPTPLDGHISSTRLSSVLEIMPQDVRTSAASSVVGNNSEARRNNDWSVAQTDELAILTGRFLGIVELAPHEYGRHDRDDDGYQVFRHFPEASLFFLGSAGVYLCVIAGHLNRNHKAPLVAMCFLVLGSLLFALSLDGLMHRPKASLEGWKVPHGGDYVLLDGWFLLQD